MIKEEWRSHSTMFGSMMFAFFPFMIAVFSFAGSLFLPLFTDMLPAVKIALLVHYMFFLLGLSVGGFGLFTREVMNRRFGQASLIAYSSRSLPVSERKIFLNFFVKDVIYYFIFWIIPFMAGLAFALPFIGVGLDAFIMLVASLSLSFLIGLSVIFFLSTLYAHSSRFFVTALVLLAFCGVLLAGNFSLDALEYLPSFSFFTTRSAEQLAVSLLVIIIPAAISLVFLKVDYPERKKRYRNSLDRLSSKLGFLSNPHFISKDFLDMSRSEGGIGKIIFSFIFPVAIIWVLLYIFLKFIPIADFLLLFSILMGTVASSIYDWLTEYDVFTSYAFLPVKVSTLLKSKVGGYVIINLVPLAILLLTTFLMNSFYYLPIALLLFVSVSAYALAVKMYLGGLCPTILLYSAKIFLAFVVMEAPILLAMIIISILNPLYLLASPLLILVSLGVIKKSYVKWDNLEQPSF